MLSTCCYKRTQFYSLFASIFFLLLHFILLLHDLRPLLLLLHLLTYRTSPSLSPLYPAPFSFSLPLDYCFSSSSTSFPAFSVSVSFPSYAFFSLFFSFFNFSISFFSPSPSPPPPFPTPRTILLTPSSKSPPPLAIFAGLHHISLLLLLFQLLQLNPLRTHQGD